MGDCELRDRAEQEVLVCPFRCKMGDHIGCYVTFGECRQIIKAGKCLTIKDFFKYEQERRNEKEND